MTEERYNSVTSGSGTYVSNSLHNMVCLIYFVLTDSASREQSHFDTVQFDTNCQYSVQFGTDCYIQLFYMKFGCNKDTPIRQMYDLVYSAWIIIQY